MIGFGLWVRQDQHEPTNKESRKGKNHTSHPGKKFKLEGIGNTNGFNQKGVQ